MSVKRGICLFLWLGGIIWSVSYLRDLFAVLIRFTQLGDKSSLGFLIIIVVLMIFFWIFILNTLLKITKKNAQRGDEKVADKEESDLSVRLVEFN